MNNHSPTSILKKALVAAVLFTIKGEKKLRKSQLKNENEVSGLSSMLFDVAANSWCLAGRGLIVSHSCFSHFLSFFFLFFRNFYLSKVVLVVNVASE